MTDTIQYRCPVRHDLLTKCASSQFVGSAFGRKYPIQDGIPILLANVDEIDQIAETDWDRDANSESAVQFYNQTRDHDAYCRTELDDKRTDIQRWLSTASVAGPVLEIGSGKGALQGMGDDYVALDYSFTALRKYIEPRFQRVCGTGDELPFFDCSFRMVFSIAALEHIPHVDRAFAEIDRVLKPGGVAYLWPAWHCEQYNCEGIPVRRLAELNLRQKWTKLTLPIRNKPLFKAAKAFPARCWRRGTWSCRPGPTEFRFLRLRPDYQHFWCSDSDAAARLDSHEACLFFMSRGYEVLSPGRKLWRQLLIRHRPVVVRKPGKLVVRDGPPSVNERVS